MQAVRPADDKKPCTGRSVSVGVPVFLSEVLRTECRQQIWKSDGLVLQAMESFLFARLPQTGGNSSGFFLRQGYPADSEFWILRVTHNCRMW